MIKASDMIDHSGISLEPVLRTAFIKTLSSWMPAFKHLPIPVRFRASVRCTHGRRYLMHCLAPPPPPHVPDRVGPILQTLFTVSSDMPAFWLRPSALYEPTLPLSSLLGGVDMSQDLLMSLLQPPNATRRNLEAVGAQRMGIPSAPTDTDDQLSEAHVDRKARLRTTVFHFPKKPADGVKQLELLDFNSRNDPLDDLGVYELSDPRFS